MINRNYYGERNTSMSTGNIDARIGGKVICPPPKSFDTLNERLKDDSVDKITWYLAKKDLK